MKWNETREEKRKKRKKSEKKEKSNWNLWCYVISFLPSYLITILLHIFFPLPTLPKTRRVILSKRIYFSLCLSFFPLALRYYRHSLDWHKFDRAVHAHTLTLSIPLHSSNVWKRRKRGLQEDTATRSRRPSRESTLKKPVVCPVSIIGRQLITRHVARHINENPSVTRAASRRGLIIIKRNDVAETGSEAERFSTWRIERERERETCLEIGWIGLDEIMHLSRGDSSFSKEILEEIKELIESIREYY